MPIVHDDYNIEKLKAAIAQDKEIIAVIIHVLANIKPDAKLNKLKALCFIITQYLRIVIPITQNKLLKNSIISYIFM